MLMKTKMMNMEMMNIETIIELMAMSVKRRYCETELADLIQVGYLYFFENPDCKENEIYNAIRNYAYKERNFSMRTYPIYDDIKIDSDIDIELFDLYTEIDKLNETEQLIINLIYYKNFSQSEVAWILNTNQKAISRRLKAIEDKLKNGLEQKIL